MTIADDNEKPRPTKKLDKSLDAIAALREAMEQKLAEARITPVVSSKPVVTSPESAIATAPPPPKSQPEQPPTAPPAEPPVEESKTKAVNTVLASAGPAEWSRIMLSIAERSQKLILNFLERAPADGKNAFGSDIAPFLKAIAELNGHVLNDPEHFVDAQIALWQGYASIWQAALARLQGKPEDLSLLTDKRFQSKEWQSNWLLDYLKQIYLLSVDQTKNWIHRESADLDPKIRARVEFFTRQLTDAVAPNNFWLTNPDVLRATLETGGENLVKGLENLLHDLERGHGNLRISMTDERAFEVGTNLAVTPGKVVFQNHLIQLIQYAPLTPTVHKTPLLILPPWINKFYVLDLRPKNSFVRYLVESGYTVFVVSWVNPTAKYALINFDDYMVDGAFAAMREVRRITSEPDINMVGYCIGGTLLASALAYLKAAPTPPGDLPTVTSATYLVTLVDFAEPGDLGVFIDEEMISLAEDRMARQGFMDAASMSTVFNLLRANDLVWSYVINNYLLGKEPVPFDILYWNADSTNMPAVMQSYYLRKMYLENRLVKPNGLLMKDVPINLQRIDTPSYILSTRDDHIAPWKSTYAATQIYGGDVTFTLAVSGHIAGVVNHPSANKYGYWTNPTCPAQPEEWMQNAEDHKGSWWPHWLGWLAPKSGEWVKSRDVKDGIEDAPGSYVIVRAL